MDEHKKETTKYKMHNLTVPAAAEHPTNTG